MMVIHSREDYFFSLNVYLASTLLWIKKAACMAWKFRLAFIPNEKNEIQH